MHKPCYTSETERLKLQVVIRFRTVYYTYLQSVREADYRHSPAAYCSCLYAHQVGAVGRGDHYCTVLYGDCIEAIRAFYGELGVLRQRNGSQQSSILDNLGSRSSALDVLHNEPHSNPRGGDDQQNTERYEVFFTRLTHDISFHEAFA